MCFCSLPTLHFLHFTYSRLWGCHCTTEQRSLSEQMTLTRFKPCSLQLCFLLYEYWEAQTYCYIVLFTLQKKNPTTTPTTDMLPSPPLPLFCYCHLVLFIMTHFLEKQKNKKGVMRCHELYTGFRKLKPSYSQEKTRVKVRFFLFFFFIFIFYFNL